MTITLGGFLISFLIGVGIGFFYFYGLWWTIRKLPTVRQPGLWTFASFLLRTGVGLVAFYYSMQGQWQRLLVSLVGFMMTRAILARRFRPDSLKEPAE
jgi:F1F0 ATPase subunit 2